MSFSAAHRAKLHSTNPIELLNGEIKGAPQSVGSVRGPVMSRRILEILARALSHSRRYCRKRFKARISAYCNDIVIPSRPRET
jgi:transposase-like protein